MNAKNTHFVPPFDPETQLLSVAEVAAQLGVSISVVYKLIRSREIPSVEFCRRLLVPRDKLMAWIERRMRWTESTPVYPMANRVAHASAKTSTQATSA
jgi:excisionase family DNA binding protein